MLVVVAVCTLLLAACGDGDDSDSSSASRGEVYTEQDSEISVARGDEFVIELPATPSTGYAWTAQDDDLVSLEHTDQVRGGSMPGAQGTQRLTFRAEAEGSTTLVLDYERSFEPGVPPAETASFDVTVTG